MIDRLQEGYTDDYTEGVPLMRGRRISSNRYDIWVRNNFDYNDNETKILYLSKV